MKAKIDVTFYSPEAIDLAMAYASSKQKMYLVAYVQGHASNKEIAAIFANQDAILHDIDALAKCLQNKFGDGLADKRVQFEEWINRTLPEISRARANDLWFRAHDGLDAVMIGIGHILQAEADSVDENSVGLDLWRIRKLIHLSMVTTALAKTSTSIHPTEFDIARRYINGHVISRIARKNNCADFEIFRVLELINQRALSTTNVPLFPNLRVPPRGGGLWS